MATEVITSLQADSPGGARPIRLLSLDGGGMRGHYTAAVLDNLCRRFADGNHDGAHFDLGACFDGIVGVSTGSIIAAALASGVSPIEVLEFYRLWGPKIFVAPVPDFGSMRGFEKWRAYAKFLWQHRDRSFNSADVLADGLREVLETATFGSLYQERKIALLVPAVDLSTHNFWVYKTPHIEGKHRDDSTSLVDACLASSAAPYFFPLAYSDRPFVDGGLAANNPVLLALIEAMEMTKSEQDRPIEIISVGTCPPPVGDHVKREDRNWGFMQWKLIERFSATVLDSQVSMHMHTTRFLLPHINRKATIFRLHQSEPNAEQARRLGLDRADREALEILELRGSVDAERVHQDVGKNFDPRLAPIREIFSGAKIIEEETR